ncbi:MAG: hypothetical protein CVU90_04750 [Firmicutes bacterium HGW-Firmicutes-15]|nr:MAG: hypothetical protein CVU90_04750 [Firmicutes bacterium HGW-Firmicutes-15]
MNGPRQITDISKSKQAVGMRSQSEEERKYIDMELARLDRLSLIGEMAASIGHEYAIQSQRYVAFYRC